MSDKKYQILKNDWIDIRHPRVKDKLVRIYKIIALKEFRISVDKTDGAGSSRVSTTITIEKYEIGGYIQSEDNLDQTDNSWVRNDAKVFDEAFITGNSLIFDDAAAFECSKISGGSNVGGYARVFGNAEIDNGTILGGKTNVFGHARILKSLLFNGSSIYGHAVVESCEMRDGALIHGNANVSNCVMVDVSEIRGHAKLENCKLTGRAIVEDGEYKNETFHKNVTLNVGYGEGEIK